MNMTTSAFFEATSESFTVFPLVTSFSAKSGAGVPSGNIVEGVKTMGSSSDREGRYLRAGCSSQDRRSRSSWLRRPYQVGHGPSIGSEGRKVGYSSSRSAERGFAAEPDRSALCLQ